MKIMNPATGQVLREIQDDTPDTVREKVERARIAQRRWATLPLDVRLDIMRGFLRILQERTEELAALLTSEMGKPITQARNELKGMPERVTFFIDNTATAIADEVVLRLISGRDGTQPPDLEERIKYEPLGVVVNISAWNYPYFVGSNVWIPALLTGNAVIYKPSEFATLSGLAIADMMHSAGVPDDIFATVAGDGSVGASLLDADIDAIFFTGSYATGQKIAEAAARKLIKVQLELGGKDPVYICEDVDVDAAAASMAEGAFYNAGQSCCAVERIYVREEISEEFIAKLTDRVDALVVGDPTHDETFLGPLARAQQLDVLEQQVAEAVSKGARLLRGGRRADGAGNYFAPAVLADVTGEMSIMQEESFGPVIGVQVVKDDEEAIECMNDTEFGLTAGVYTKDRKRAESILSHVNAGTAYWNCCDRVSPRLPWTGRGHSGMGSTLSLVGIRAFTQPKAYHLRRA